MDWIKNTFFLATDKNLLVLFLDIFIVSFVIYKFYNMLKRTRGIQLLLGVSLIWISGVIAERFELELVDWIVTTIRPALVFAIIVLLQPELRRITGELSQFRIFNLFLLKHTVELDPIVEAVKNMSINKVGSIIVLIRGIGHRDIIENSVPLDAIVSASLIETIFWKNTPLHDGAVIIEQNRIVSAASYLPMSSNLENSTFGARHRSALGLSEESDAIIIVTSEETGEISICFEGKLIHPVRPQELKGKLSEFLQQKTKHKEDQTSPKDPVGATP